MEKQNMREFKSMLQEINYYKKMMNITICPYEKMYWINIITYKIEEILNDMDMKKPLEREVVTQESKEFTIEKLSKYDGSMGKPAYVAVNGLVYDVSLNSAWGGGTHFGLYAGKDLSKEFKGCHDDKIELLKNLPIVGNIK
jgi:predicted heme/steroid binding protein